MTISQMNVREVVSFHKEGFMLKSLITRGWSTDFNGSLIITGMKQPWVLH